jgi:two-component system phosphate regulon sensor histidine kinase PhoR
VSLISFLAGLAIGGLALLIYRVWLSRKLDRMLSSTALDNSGFSLSGRLAYAFREINKQQRQQQAELLAWKSVIDQGPMGYLLVDEDNQLLDCNAQAANLLNIQIDRQHYRATEPRLLLELVRSYELDQLIEQARDRNQLCQKEWRLYPVSIELENISASTQQIIYLRGYAFPLTSSHITVLLESRQEEVLLAQQRDRWASDVAHELKTPLTSIRLVAETLQTRLEPPLRQWVDRLLAEVIRLSTLVQEILDLSQLESLPERHLQLSQVDLPQLIRSAWQNLEPIAQDYDITLDYAGPNYLIVQADESHLFRVMINLLDNSLKYSPPHQTIQVKLQLLEQSPYVQIEIIDAGPGFPEIDLPLVFERFYRGDPSRTRSTNASIRSGSGATNSHNRTTINRVSYGINAGSGSGLGLAIVRQIIELHSGKILAYNHPETGGAWIQIRLPQQAIGVVPMLR